MHILQITPYFPPTWAYGGIPRIVDGLSRALQQHAQVTVWTTDAFDKTKRCDLPFEDNYHGIRVLRLRNLSNRLAYQQQLFLPMNYGVALRSMPQRPDVIHMHGHRHLLNNIAYRYAKKHNIPYVLTANGTLARHEKKQTIKWFWDQFIAAHIPLHANQCIAVSPADVAIHRQHGIPLSNITLIPNGLDLAEFSPAPAKGVLKKQLAIESARLIVYLGQLSPRKGIVHLIQAFVGGDFSGCHLAIAGNDMGALSDAKAAAKQHPRIHFLGLLAGRKRLELLADADVLVYPSSHEIFGLAPFEGLLCGAPAIVSDDCGCGQLIHHAQAGLLVRYGDIKDLQHKLRLLLYDRIAAQAMVERGKKYIHNNLRFSTIAHKHLQLYQQLLQGT